ncbi:MAG: hypothetical protein CK425_00575 [Parachlamydia sp.]|nr:MAG: hypothetical protein CK425_00575 [Parachlamydia sp.]
MVRPTQATTAETMQFCSFLPPPKVDLKPDVPDSKINVEEGITQHSWLTEELKKPLSSTFNFKVFAQEACDPFIKNTSLEGNSIESALDRFLDCWERSEASQSAPGIRDLFREALTWARELSHVTDSNAEDQIAIAAQAVAKKMIDRVSALKIGEQVLLPGGWTKGDNGGHALYILIKKTSKDTYSLVVSTTGAGLEYNSHVIDGELRADTFFRLEKVKASNLCSEEFFQSLIELNTLPSWKHSLNFEAKNLYEGILLAVKGKRKTPRFMKKDRKFMRKPQHSGSCSTEAIFGFIRAIMLEEPKTVAQKRIALQKYRTFKFAYRKRSLADACAYFFNPATPWSRTEHKLIAASSAKLARSAHKLYNDKLLSEDEVKTCAFTELDIKNRLSAKKKEDQALHVDHTEISFKISQNPKGKAPVPLAMPPLAKHNQSAPKKTSPIQSVPDYPLPKVEEITSALIPQTLQSWVQQLEKYSTTPHVDPNQISESLSSFLYALPLPNSIEGQEFWNKVPDEQINPCLAQLFKLSRFYFEQDQSKQPSPKAIIGSHIAMVLGENLSRRQKENKLKDYHLDYSGLIAFSQSIQTTLVSPIDQKKLQDVLQAALPEYQLSKFISAKKLKAMQEKALFSLYGAKLFQFVRSDSKEMGIRFYELFLEQAADELEKRGLGLATIETKIATVMCERVKGSGLLPEGLLYLRQLSFFATGMLQAPDTKSPAEWYYHFDPDSETKRKENLIFVSIEDGNGLLQLSKKSKGIHVSFNYLKSPPGAGKKISTHFLDSKQNHVMGKILEEELRDCGITGVEKVDELSRAMAYYQERSEALFEDPIEQYIFSQHLLRPGRLLNQLMNEPRMAIKLMSFINNRLAFFQSCGKRDPLLYFCKLGHFCKRYVNYAQKQNPAGFKELETDLKNILIDYRKTAIEAIIPKCITLPERNAVYQSLKDFHIGANIDSLSHEDIKTIGLDFFLAKIYAPISLVHQAKKANADQLNLVSEKKTHKPISSEWNSEVQKQFYSILLPKVQDIMKNDHAARDEILNGILNKLTQNDYGLTWTGDYPKFISGQFEIDLFTNKVSDNGKVFANLPEWLFERDKNFSLIFDEISEVKVKEDGRYLIKDRHGMTELEVYPNQKKFIAERLINGVNYRFTPETSFPSSFNAEMQNHVIDSTTSIWLSLEPTDPHYLIRKEKQQDGKKTKDLIVHLAQVAPGNYAIDCVTDDPKKKRVLINPWHTECLASLKDFEIPRYIFFWADPANLSVIKEIEMKRFGLHFDVMQEKDGEAKAWCREVPGYYLSQKQKQEFGDEWPSYLLLQNAAGQKKVLIPKADSITVECSDPKKPFDIKLVFSQQSKATCDALLYDLEEIEGVKGLRASSVSDSLYLAALYLEKKRYSDALYYIGKSHNLGIFSNGDIKVIKKMLEHFFHDGHPSATVTGLKVLLMVEENKLKYDPNYHLSFETKNKRNVGPNQQWQDAANKYLEYVQNLNNTSVAKLTIEEEKSILRLFMSKGFDKTPYAPYLIQRIQQLMYPQKKISPIAMPNPDSQMPVKFGTATCSSHTFFNFFKSGEYKAVSPNQLIMSMTKENFLTYFVEYYEWARSGTPAEKLHLKRLLEMLKGTHFYQQERTEKRSEVMFLFEVLKRTLAKPQNFPLRHEIFRLSEEGEFMEKHRFFNERIVAKLRNSLLEDIQVIFERLKKLPQQLLLSIKYSLSIGAVKKFMFSMPQEPKNAHAKKIPFAANLSQLDLADNAFFEEIFKNNFTVEQKPIEDDIKIEQEANDPLSKAYLEKIKKDLEQFYETRSKTKSFYHLNSPLDLPQTKKILAKGLETALSKLSAKEAELLTLINKPSEKNFHLDILRRAGKKIPTLSLSQAIELFEEGRLDRYRQLTCLTDAEIVRFESLMTQYLVSSTRSQQAMRLMDYLQTFEKLPDEADEKVTLIQKMGEELTATRQYSEANAQQQRYLRALLVFEHRNKLLLRKKQVDVLDRVLNHPHPTELILQLGTGSGKSKVLAQLFEWIRRITTGHVANLWPSALYPVNKYDIKKQSEATFNQRSDTFDFDRENSTDIHHLAFVHRELKRARIEGRQLNARPESLQSAELKFLETLFNASQKGKAAFQGKINQFQEILREFLRTEFHFDEAHITLGSKKEVNFTVAEASTEPLDNILFLEEMFRYLSQDAEVAQWVNIKANQQHLISKETIKKQICPALALHMGKFLEIDAAQQKEFLEYVMGKTPQIPQWVTTHPKKQQIGLLKGKLTVLLPEILYKRIVNVHFGLSKVDPKKKHAKPYEASDSPVENADYDNIHETLSKTYLTYLHNRLKDDQIWEMISHLQAAALSESKRRLIDVKETKAYQFYAKYFPLGLGELFGIEKKHIADWSKDINVQDEIIFYYIRTFVAPSIKKYALKFKSDAQNLKSQVGSLMAMSATPGNPATYGFTTKYQSDLGSDEQVLEALAKKCADPKTLHSLPADSSMEFFEKILAEIFLKNSGFRVLIDIGALFKGLSNLEMAEKLLAHFTKIDPEIKGIVFFHGEILMSLEVDRKEPIPFEQSQLAPNHRFTLYDHKHAFGLDIKQSSRAKGLATFAKHNTKDDILQGAGRMRELLQDQDLEWVTSQSVLEAMHTKPEQFTFNDLRNLGFKNQAELEADDLQRSIKQQMRNEIRSVLMKKLIFAKSESQAIKFFKDFAPILLEKVETEAFNLYGGIAQKRTDREDLILYRDGLLRELAKLTKLKRSEKTAIRKKLLGYEQRIQEKEKFLSPKKKRHLVSIGVEAEIQQQVETKTEVNREIHATDLKDLQILKPTPWPSKMNLYEDQWMKPTSTQVLRIKQILKRLICLPKDFGTLLTKPVRNPRGGLIGAFVTGLIMPPVIIAVVPIFASLGAVAFGAIVGNGIFPLIGRITKFNQSCRLYQANTVVKMAKDRKISTFHKFFQNKPQTALLMTNNFITLKPQRTENPVLPLGKEQKPLYEVLVIQDELPDGNKKLTVMMGDQSTDAYFWRQKLEEDVTQTPAEVANARKRKICLYDLNIGIVQNGKNAFDEQALKDNPLFQELIVKAKIYNADVTYTDKEEVALKRLVRTPKVKTKLRAFFDKAQTWHDAKRMRFQDSPIDIVLNENAATSAA